MSLHTKISSDEIKRMNLSDAAHINANLGVKIDWWRRLDAAFRLDSSHFFSRTEALQIYQRRHHLPANGILTAQTRLSLIRAFPDLRITCIGPHLQTRSLLSDRLSASEQYDVLSDYASSQFAQLSTLDCVPNLIAIRGVSRKHNAWFQTESAALFAASPFGSRSHFSSHKPDFADSLLAVLWRQNNAKHVRLFPCVVNPQAIWSHGTAHLNTGQYAYKIGKHRTRDIEHMRAARAIAHHIQNFIIDDTNDSVQYIALEGTSPIEVIRSSGNSLDLSPNDIERAEIAIAQRQPAFVDHLHIKINIHTCAASRASSLGCQNILPSDYPEFIQTLLDLRAAQIDLYGFPINFPYILLDASFL